MIAGIAFALLAAGSARRFGGGKLGVQLGAKPLLRWAADAAEMAGFQTRLLVLSSASDSDFGLAGGGWTIVENPDAETGIASSIRAAATVARHCERLVLGLADMPFVTSEHYRNLAASKGVVFTRYPSGRNGVPAAFDRNALARLETLEGENGATRLAWPNAAAIAPPSDGHLLDVDTAEDLAKARALVESL